MNEVKVGKLPDYKSRKNKGNDYGFDPHEQAHEIADLIAANGPLAVQAILKTMRDSEGKHEDDCWAADAKVGAAVFSSDDAKEGPRAFLEKRKAEFKGR